MVKSQTPNKPALGLSPLRGTFVDPQREMRELKAALEDGLSGRGRLVTLVGELQLLRSYVQQQAPEQFQPEMGPGAADIAEVLPELREKLPDLQPTPTLEPEQARFRLFNSITTFLKNAAQYQPLMLVLEDLHWADRSSLLLLEFLAREIESSPLLVLGTYRDVEVSRRHPLSETLGSLIREQRFLRVQLSGLAEQEVEQLIKKTAVVRPPPGSSVTIQRSEGNPLFVTENIRMLPGEGVEEGKDYTSNILERVRTPSAGVSIDSR